MFGIVKKRMEVGDGFFFLIENVRLTVWSEGIKEIKETYMETIRMRPVYIFLKARGKLKSILYLLKLYFCS